MSRPRPGRDRPRRVMDSAGEPGGVRSTVRAVLLSGRVTAGTVTAWLMPERFWLPATRLMGRVMVRLGSSGRSARDVARQTGAGTPDDAPPHRAVSAAVAIERIAAGHAARLYGLREYRPGRRRPPIELRGADQLRRALEAGHGAILWIARFAFAPLFFKIALCDAGFAVSHLSRPTHGFDASPFAIRWLNPIWTRIEERYLYERVVMHPGGETAALRTLRRRLAENRVVSITVGDEAVRTTRVELPDGPLHLATGPMHLALSSGAPLMPVFVVRTSEGEFLVDIQSPLDTTPGVDREARFAAIAAEYADRLEPFIHAYPGQWIP